MGCRATSVLSQSRILCQLLCLCGLLVGMYLISHSPCTRVRPIKHSAGLEPPATKKTALAGQHKVSLREVPERQQKKRRLPSALIIGCMKGGTGTLQKFLSLHPSIAMAAEEDLNFFNNHYWRGLEWYRTQMTPSYEHQITMEKSNYFGSIVPDKDIDYVPWNIKHLNNNMKLILIVRDPVKRIISQFSMNKAIHKRRYKNVTLENLVFDKTSGAILSRTEYIRYSSYYYSMQRWLKYFPKQQFLILDSSEFVRNPLSELKKVEKFLNIQNFFTKDMFPYDKDRGFYCFKNSKGEKECMYDGKGRKHEDVPPKTILKLKKYFKPLNKQFMSLMNLSFTWP